MDDADEQLARALQAAEDAAAAQAPAQPPSLQERLLSMARDCEAKVLLVEDAQLQARARALMPLDSWLAAAAEQVALNRSLDPGGVSTAAEEDLVVQAMLKWFKSTFFSWVDAPACSVCSSSTTHAGMGKPSAQERGDGAGRVELYTCSVCGEATRFPRYTRPAKLLETRRGRCGEWAHTFLLMLRAAGYDARHVCDNADHVWNEYWSAPLGRWVHVDSCEAAWDTPLLYEGGWGKKLAFVLAASRHGHADVTKRYVLPGALPQLASRRAGVPDLWLGQLLAKLTAALRTGLTTAQRHSMAARDATEVLQLMSLESDPAADAAAAAAAAALPGRQSGAEAWRQARGETGRAAAAGQPGTPYAQAQDGALPALFAAAGRVTGGVCRASGEHNAMVPTQVVSRLFDGSLASKWLDFSGGGEGGSAWVEYRLLPSADQLVVTHYDVISAEDCPERDLQDWVLEAAVGSSRSSSNSQQQQEEWVELHRCTGHVFSGRHQLCSFVVPPQARVSSSRWRLRISRVAQPAQANSVQLACWNLCTASTSSSVRDRLAGLAGAQELATLRRILTNLAQQPGEPKFFKLSCKAAALRALLEQPALAAALRSVGFRPVLSVAGEQTLVADARKASGVAAAAREALEWMPGAAASQPAS